MKPLATCTVAGASALLSGQAALAQVNVAYDGAQSVFSVGQTGRPLAISAAYACPGDAECRPAVVRVEFSAYQRKKPRYDDDHAVLVVVDASDSLRVENPAYAARGAAANQVYESIVWMMKLDEFLALANATKVEYSIGPDESELSDKQREALAALAGKIPAADEPMAKAEEPETSDPDR